MDTTAGRRPVLAAVIGGGIALASLAWVWPGPSRGLAWRRRNQPLVSRRLIIAKTRFPKPLSRFLTWFSSRRTSAASRSERRSWSSMVLVSASERRSRSSMVLPSENGGPATGPGWARLNGGPARPLYCTRANDVSQMPQSITPHPGESIGMGRQPVFWTPAGMPIILSRTESLVNGGDGWREFAAVRRQQRGEPIFYSTMTLRLRSRVPVTRSSSAMERL